MTEEERKTIEELYRDLFPFLMNYARSSLSNEPLSEEAVQETFRIACLKSSDLYNSPNQKGWIINTLKNVIRNTLRSQENANRLLSQYYIQMNHGEAVTEDTIRLELLYENIAYSDDFKLITEMAIEGRSHLEMAQKRGISVNACKKRVQRAKESLKKKLF